MKNTGLSLFMLLLIPTVIFGQSVIIGTGTANTNGNIADPIERYYQYERFQIVFTAAELTSAGMPAGAVINALGFSVSQSAVSLANYTIDIGLTAQATADPYISTGLVNVRTPFTYSPLLQAAGSFDMISFTSAFAWDGVSNLVVNTCTGPNPFVIPYGGLRYTTAASGSVRYIRNDGFNYCSVTTVENSSLRPNIQFNYTPGTGACAGTPSPGNTLSSVSIACSGLEFSLSLQNTIPGSGVSYEWQSSPDGMSSWVNMGLSTPECETSQTAVTHYRCLVSCSGNTAASVPVLVDMNSSSEYVYLEDTISGAECYGATNEIILAGYGSTCMVPDGGRLDLAAGMAIYFLPGTTVQPGGYLLGYIDPCGPYCSPGAKPAGTDHQQQATGSSKHPGFSVRPNPTSGDFILEMTGNLPEENFIVSIYGSRGEIIMHDAIIREQSHAFSLSGVPAGVYFLRIISGNRADCIKIIKQ